MRHPAMSPQKRDVALPGAARTFTVCCLTLVSRPAAAFNPSFRHHRTTAPSALASATTTAAPSEPGSAVLGEGMGSTTGSDNVDPVTGEYLHQWLIRYSSIIAQRWRRSGQLGPCCSRMDETSKPPPPPPPRPLDRPTAADSAADAAASDITTLACPGGGLFFWWQAGFVQGLRDQQYDLAARNLHLTGASAGALTATLAACDVDMDRALDLALELCDRREIFERPLGLMGVWGDIVREWMEELMPDDAHEICSGRVHLLLSAVAPLGAGTPLLQRRVVSEYRWVD